MASPIGFYSTINQAVYATSKDVYIVFNTIPSVLGFNSGMLDTNTGTVTVPEESYYSINGAVTYEWNELPTNRQISVELEIDGKPSTIKATHSYGSNDPVTLNFSANVHLKYNQKLRVRLRFPYFDDTKQLVLPMGTYLSMFKL